MPIGALSHFSQYARNENYFHVSKKKKTFFCSYRAMEAIQQPEDKLEAYIGSEKWTRSTIVYPETGMAKQPTAVP